MAENDNQDQRIHELARQIRELKKQRDMEIAMLQKEVELKYAETESALDRLRADMARRDTEMAQRDKDNLRWQIGLWVAAVVILGVIIRWPSVPAITG